MLGRRCGLGGDLMLVFLLSYIALLEVLYPRSIDACSYSDLYIKLHLKITQVLRRRPYCSYIPFYLYLNIRAYLPLYVLLYFQVHVT